MTKHYKTWTVAKCTPSSNLKPSQQNHPLDHRWSTTDTRWEAKNDYILRLDWRHSWCKKPLIPVNLIQQFFLKKIQHYGGSHTSRLFVDATALNKNEVTAEVYTESSQERHSVHQSKQLNDCSKQQSTISHHIWKAPPHLPVKLETHKSTE